MFITPLAVAANGVLHMHAVMVGTTVIQFIAHTAYGCEFVMVAALSLSNWCPVQVTSSCSQTMQCDCYAMS